MSESVFYNALKAHIENNSPVEQRRRTSRWLGKFERPRILGARAEQIGNGDKIYVSIPSDFSDQDPLKLARRELEERRIPLNIDRMLPNHDSEVWSLKDMILRKPRPVPLAPKDYTPIQTDPYAPLSLSDYGPIVITNRQHDPFANTQGSDFAFFFATKAHHLHRPPTTSGF